MTHLFRAVELDAEVRRRARIATLTEIADIAHRQAGCAAPEVSAALLQLEQQLLQLARQVPSGGAA